MRNLLVELRVELEVVRSLLGENDRYLIEL